MSETAEKTTKKAAATEESEAGMNAKEMLERNGEAKTVIRYGDRVTMEVVKVTKHYKKVGQIISPHPVMAEQLEKDGIAKHVK